MNLAATRTIDILFFVSKNKYSSTISNISRELDIPKSTVFHIVHSLTESGMLQVQDARRMTYRIGYRAYELGLSYIAQNHVLEVVHQELLSLTAAVRMSGGYFSVRDGALVLMDMVPFSGSAYPNYHIGARFDPLEIPAGYAYLSTLPPETLAQAADLPPEARAHIQEAGHRHYGIGTTDAGIVGISVPVLEPEGRCAGVLCLYTLAAQVDAAIQQSAVLAAQQSAAQIARHAGRFENA